MGGGPSSTTQTTKQAPWGPVKPFAKQEIGQAQQLYSSGQYPNQQVAPFSPAQQQGFDLTSGLTGPEQQYLGQSQGEQAATAAGQYLDPSSNQFLQSYYDAAAQPMIQNYQQAVAPNILQNAVASGGLGSSGTEQAFQNAQSSLAEGLGTLGANIYEPAYQQERQLQQSAQQNAPTMAGAQYLPAQQLLDVGQQQQQQQQNELNTQFGNQMRPYQMLQQAAGLISPLGGSGGSQISVGANPYQTAK